MPCVSFGTCECSDERMRKTCDAPHLDECEAGGMDARRNDMDARIVVYICIPTGTCANAHTRTHTHTQKRKHTHTWEITSVDSAL